MISLHMQHVIEASFFVLGKIHQTDFKFQQYLLNILFRCGWFISKATLSLRYIFRHLKKKTARDWHIYTHKQTKKKNEKKTKQKKKHIALSGDKKLLVAPGVAVQPYPPKLCYLLRLAVDENKVPPVFSHILRRKYSNEWIRTE